MAISEQEKSQVKERFTTAAKLIAVDLDIIEPLYPVDEDEAIVAVRIETGPHQFDIWAIDRTSTPIVGVKVGTQDEHGRFNWGIPQSEREK